VKIFRFGFAIIHIAIIVLLCGTLLNDYVSPKTFPGFNLLSLAFPVLMILNVLLIIFWIVLWKKRAIFFILASFLFLNPIKRWINYSPESAEKSNLKVVSMNIKGGTMGREKVYEYLKNSGADIVFAQEYGDEFNVPGYAHHTNQHEIVALNSKQEIVSQGELASDSVGNAFFADIKTENKIIRIVNVYMNPFSFDKQKVKPGEDLDKNKTKVMYILKKLIPTFKVHQEEVATIRKAIDESPYPVMLVGDFNAVPNSYEYYHLGKGLTDAFVEVGRGSSTSFHDYKFPIRIDYIFTSKEIKPIRYRVDRSVKLSDHFPVIAEFKIE
jgi:endonuclease/exonuclease/phosphatase (EEP) superfamily protein YafD